MRTYRRSLRLPLCYWQRQNDTQFDRKENCNDLRGRSWEKPMSKSLTYRYVLLGKIDRTLNAIPNKVNWSVVGNANLSTGGKAIDVTDQVHPTIRICVAAAKRGWI
jgi:cyanophycin synthetase